MQLSDFWGTKLHFTPVLSRLGPGDIQAAVMS